MSNFSQQFPTTAFGDMSVAAPVPIAQLLGTTGLSSKTVVTVVDTGSGIADGRSFVASTGIGANALGAISAKEIVTYRPGQGVRVMFTAVYTAGVADSFQLVGTSSGTDGLTFGYVGATFGVVRRADGENEIQDLQVTTAAGGAENATVTIDGTGYTVPLTAGTVQHNAAEIADSLSAQVPNYVFQQNDDTVTAKDNLAEVVAGAFSFSSATAVAAWSQINIGAPADLNFTAQSSWNQNTFPSLDPTKGNVYKIQFQYLGYGGIEFYVEDKTTAEFVLVHRIEYANTFTTPSLGDPNTTIGLAAFNNGNTTDISVASASLVAMTEGEIVRTEPPRVITITNAAVGTTQVPLFSVRNRADSLSLRGNKQAVVPIQFSGATDSTKGMTFSVIINGTLTGENFDYVDKAASITSVDTSATAVTGGREVISITVVAGSGMFDIERIRERLQPDDIITISAVAVAAPAASATSTLIYVEDI